jgi:electron transport complex protein RnfC
MLITVLKPKDDILRLAAGKTVIISCEGCKEVHFPETEALQLQSELVAGGAASAAVVTDYICSPENLDLQLKKHMEKIGLAGTLLVFSCGVGVQTVAEKFPGMQVYAACDTYPLPGHQGVTPLEYDCAECGECYLNSTGGICPITACSKSLVNGQCGGSKNGNCEVDKDMLCGWDRIYKRLETLDLLEALNYPAKIRNFAKEVGK